MGTNVSKSYLETQKGGIDQNGAENVQITVKKMKIMGSVAVLVFTFKSDFMGKYLFSYLVNHSKVSSPRHQRILNVLQTGLSIVSEPVQEGAEMGSVYTVLTCTEDDYM
ncbi:hypothetical protein STEG23_014075 [Scotinomys teguina]